MNQALSLPADFSLILRPNRSLSARGFFWLMLGFGGVSFATGTYFWSLGAWPVFGFFGVDVLLLYGAFKLNYRHSKRYETLEMRDNRLVFSQVSALGTLRDWEFDPYWVRVKLERFGEGDEEIGNLILSSHGKYVSVGAFLSPQERASLAASLQLSLTRMRDRLTGGQAKDSATNRATNRAAE